MYKLNLFGILSIENHFELLLKLLFKQVNGLHWIRITNHIYVTNKKIEVLSSNKNADIRF